MWKYDKGVARDGSSRIFSSFFWSKLLNLIKEWKCGRAPIQKNRKAEKVLNAAKVSIVLKNASNKNCIKRNFLQKAPSAHVFISPRSGGRGSKHVSYVYECEPFGTNGKDVRAFCHMMQLQRAFSTDWLHSRSSASHKKLLKWNRLVWWWVKWKHNTY